MSKLQQVQNQTDTVKEQLIHNVEQVMERGEQLEVLDTKAQALEISAARFNKNARDVRFKYCREHYKHMLCILLLVMVVILLIVWVFGGFK